MCAALLCLELASATDLTDQKKTKTHINPELSTCLLKMSHLSESTIEFMRDFWSLSSTEVFEISAIFEKKGKLPNKEDVVAIFIKVLNKINSAVIKTTEAQKDATDIPTVKVMEYCLRCDKKTDTTKNQASATEPPGSAPSSQGNTSNVTHVTPTPSSGDKTTAAPVNSAGSTGQPQSAPATDNGDRTVQIQAAAAPVTSNITPGGAPTPEAQKRGPRQDECYHLRAGNCRYGRAGDTPDEQGKTCPYTHPRRKCKAHLKGGGSSQGCQDKQCRDMHPLVCMGWKIGQECRMRDCKRLHPLLPPSVNRAPRNRAGPRLTAPGTQDRLGSRQTGNSQQPRASPWLHNNTHAEPSGEGYNNQHTNRSEQGQLHSPSRENQAVFLDERFKTFQREISQQIANTVHQILAQQQQQ